MFRGPVVGGVVLDTEAVPACPLCGGEGAEVLHEGLVDSTFAWVAGSWTMKRCLKCGAGFLDPRPTPAAIGRAYGNYYTHDGPAAWDRMTLGQRVRRCLAHGYLNFRFGTRLRPASCWGILAALLLPDHRANLHAEMRHLPRPKPGDNLLDVGCGDGRFLDLARSAGWEVMGVETDPGAVAAARKRGLDVRQGGVEILVPTGERFSGITLNHVIEHCHDPPALLRICQTLLKPGGWIWIETPNLESSGHWRFGPHWRGLEPPRHLVLFTFDSLERAMREAGFVRIEIQPFRPMCHWIFQQSEALASGERPDGTSPLSPDGWRAAREADEQARRRHQSREMVTLKGWKE